MVGRYTLKMLLIKLYLILFQPTFDENCSDFCLNNIIWKDGSISCGSMLQRFTSWLGNYLSFLQTNGFSSRNLSKTTQYKTFTALLFTLRY